jgi:hypothetical protein
MDELIPVAGQAIDDVFADESAATRRRFVAGAAGVIGSMGFLGATAPGALATHNRRHEGPNSVANILAIAATAEVLATIVNTVGAEKVNLDATTKRNVEAAARHELIHYNTLTSLNAKELTKRIWVPNEVFASPENFLGTLAVGDQIFVNAYLIGVTVFARPGGNSNARLSRIAAEFMAVESVHRALALQSLGKLGNDRTYAKFAQREETTGLATTGAPGFYDITKAAEILTGAGFGFGQEGSKPGQFYEFDEVSKRTPNPTDVNTRTPS